MMENGWVKRIEELEAEIAALKERIKELEAENYEYLNVIQANNLMGCLPTREDGTR